jgi:N-acyl homoserine lactone hydrolase
MTARLRGRPRRVFPLLYGWEPVTKALSLRGGSPDRFILEPVTGAAVEFDEGWVLFDTGFNPDTVRDPEKRIAHYSNIDPYYCYIACIPRGDPLVRQIEETGLKRADLAMVVISHLHCDHSGGLRLMVDGPPVVIQRAEHDFAMGEAGLEHAFFRTDYEIPGLQWNLVEGDTELAEGLRVLETSGHTPGGQSLAVQLARETIVLAGDCADLRENIEGCIPCGFTTHPDLEDAAEKAVQRMHELDQRDDTTVWPSHDPVYWDMLLNNTQSDV